MPKLLPSRLVFGLLLALASLGLYAGCQAAERDGSFDRVRQAGTLVIGVDPNYPPFATYDGQGNPIGYDIELAKEIAKRLGVGPAFVGMDVGIMVDAIVARRLDVIISGMSPAPENASRVRYSSPYFDAGEVLVVRDGGPNGVSDLAGHAVGVEIASVGDQELRKLVDATKNVRIESFLSAEEALSAVRSGELDAAVSDLVTVKQYIHLHQGLHIAGPPFFSEYYVVVGHTRDESLMAQIDKILGDLNREGYLRGLEAKWLP